MAKGRNSFASPFEELGDVDFDKTIKRDIKKDEGGEPGRIEPLKLTEEELVVPGKDPEEKEINKQQGDTKVTVLTTDNEPGVTRTDEEFAAIFFKPVSQGKISLGTQITSDHEKMLEKILMAFPVKKYVLICNLIENFYKENVKSINKEISKKLKM